MNRTTHLLLFALTLILLQWACVPPSSKVKTEITLDSSDPEFQSIIDFQDRQEKDSLYVYFQHKDPSYRYLAVMAFASIQDSTAIDSLAALLADPVDKVRAAAAYAIGQSKGNSSQRILINAFNRNDTAGDFALSNRAILESIGKCGDEEMLAALSTVSTYTPRDTFLLEGQSWGIYRYALRGINVPEGTDRMLEYLKGTEYPEKVRLIAAHYLSRSRNIKLDSLDGVTIANTFTSSSSPDIRMALAIALGKVKNSAALQTLLQQYKKEDDYRVKANILSVLGNYDYIDVQTLVIEALKDPNLHVSRRAVQYFIDHGAGADATFYWRTAKDTLPWPIQIGLYQATNKHLPAYYVDYRDAINSELRQRYRTASSTYEKAATLQALAEFPWNYRYIYREGFKSELPSIRTATMEALSTISNRRDFRSYFGGSYRAVRRDLLSYFLEAMESGDPAMIAISATALRNERMNYEDHIDSLTMLRGILEELELPKEIETYNELQHTIAFLAGEAAPTPLTPEYNHEIDWSMLGRIANGEHAIINTSKGAIELEFLPDAAPGTVINFIALVRQGFYENKTFHRVVPNFVIQGGCPRGDGYGSLDYSIRSELPHLHYDAEGYVGMASSGNHTECTQFFITHSPTPHLDGRYTIFAKVVKGMEVVHDIQMGDNIESISID
ncbi:MAG: peptidylprolyl isomerase [Chitinophagales bacterium]|nr:peptidylprolyl isomerase [Chitinophagales bacterium]